MKNKFHVKTYLSIGETHYLKIATYGTKLQVVETGGVISMRDYIINCFYECTPRTFKISNLKN